MAAVAGGGLPLEAAIKTLHEEAAVLTREAAQRLTASGPLSSSDAERILRSSLRRLLHDHVSRLRALPALPMASPDLAQEVVV